MNERAIAAIKDECWAEAVYCLSVDERNILLAIGRCELYGLPTNLSNIATHSFQYIFRGNAQTSVILLRLLRADFIVKRKGLYYIKSPQLKIEIEAKLTKLNIDERVAIDRAKDNLLKEAKTKAIAARTVGAIALGEYLDEIVNSIEALERSAS